MKRESIETSKIQYQKTHIFFVFLLLSFFIWLLMEFTKTTTSQVVFNVKYTELPSLKMIQNRPVKKVKATLKASGFQLIEYKIKNKTLAFKLSNIIEGRKKSYLLPNRQLSKLNLEFSSGVEILKIHPDTIFVELGTEIAKKVPVKLNTEISYKLGYHLVKNFKLVPDSITIVGGEKYVSKINEVTTELLKIKDAYKSIQKTVLLEKKGDHKNVNYSKEEIKVTGEIDKITEGNFKIPVKMVNVPKGVRITPFPKNVKIIYQSGLANFEQIDTKSVDVFFDYNQYKKDTTILFLTPVVKHQSKLISSLKIEPPQIEFLIQK